jgi:uncharacterized alkaline shock family protein YloU
MSRDGHVVEGPHGRIELPGSTLAALVMHAAERVPGAEVRRPRRGLAIQLEDGRASVELELTAARGAVLPDLARAVQSGVADALRATTDLDVAAVDVSIEELE